MSDSIILTQGLELLYTGMGAVFVFLGILVVATTFMSLIAQRIFPEPTEAETKPRAHGTSVGMSSDVLRIIQAAVDAHRHAKGRVKETR